MSNACKNRTRAGDPANTRKTLGEALAAAVRSANLPLQRDAHEAMCVVCELTGDSVSAQYHQNKSRAIELHLLRQLAMQRTRSIELLSWAW